MFDLICPVCGGALRQEGRSLVCGERHCFDIAKQNYVNLLRSSQSSKKHHGDDDLMVRARQMFLNKGYYTCLWDAVCDMALRYTDGDVSLLDAGCGEGWYTAGVRQAFVSEGRGCDAVGIDISRAALIRAAKRDRDISLAVASIAAMPVADNSRDVVLNIFAPDESKEFFRVLKPGGVLLHAMPMEEHLMELKAAVYDVPRPNPPARYEPKGFTLLERREIRRQITLDSNEDIRALFMMTPYYYKTGRADQAKLETLEHLTVSLAFAVFAVKKQGSDD